MVREHGGQLQPNYRSDLIPARGLDDPDVLPGPLGDERGLAGPDRAHGHQIGTDALRERPRAASWMQAVA